MARKPDRELSESEHTALAQEMYDRWRDGVPKSRLEIEYWGNATSHGKAFSVYVRKWLRHETEGKARQTEHIDRLEALLRSHGISPSDAGDLPCEYRLLAKARESALAAIRVYNDPTAGFRTETFIVLMVIAWNSLFQAMLERDGVDYFARDEDGNVVRVDDRPKVLDTAELMGLAIPAKERNAMRHNLDFFLGLRNAIAHRYLPALDPVIASEAQALLLNIERVLVDEFGEEAQLGERLSVPLQLSGFRNPESLKSLKAFQSRLPVGVMNFLNRHREEVPDDVLRSPEYALQIFFVPVSANRDRSADVVATFIKPSDVPPELEELVEKLTVVTKPKRVSVASSNLLRPSQVVSLVAERLSYRFTMDSHTRCWKHYGVRPATASAEPEATDSRYCIYDGLARGHGYTHAWVDMLVRELSQSKIYEEVIGIPPEPR